MPGADGPAAGLKPVPARAEIDGAGAGRRYEAPLYAALDLGTNNCRLLIARPARDGGFRVVDSFSRIVRLGEGLTRTGRLDERAMDRAYDALALCAERIARKGVDTGRLSAVATQARRAAEKLGLTQAAVSRRRCSCAPGGRRPRRSGPCRARR